MKPSPLNSPKSLNLHRETKGKLLTIKSSRVGSGKIADNTNLLEEKEKQFQMIYENVNDVIVLLDQFGVVTNINRKVEEVFGYRPAEIIGRRIDMLAMLSRQDLQQRLGKLLSAISGEFPFSRVDMKKRRFTAYHKYGRPIEIESNPKVILENNRVTGIIAVIRDISEQKKAERAIIAREREFLNILENSCDLVYRVNLANKSFDYISPSSERIIGYTPAEMVRFGYRQMVSIIHEADYQRIRDYFNLKRVQRRDDVEPLIEYRIKHKTLGYRWVCHTRTLIFDRDRSPIAFIGNVRDVHQRKVSELALEALHAELQQKVEERTANLEDANTALKVLVKQMDREKEELEEKILLNIRNLVLPALERLKTTHLDSTQAQQVGMISSSLDDICSPLSRKLTSSRFNLSHGEVQIAHLIMAGKTTKEIADIVKLSNRTIDFHRAQIRKKIGISNQSKNLRSCLLALS